MYEMFTGQRAFQGESRISTLAAVVERDPPLVSEAASGVPLELERLIARCLRKDVARRSQNMSDLKLALEELRDESESGTLIRPAGGITPAAPAKRRWLWPAFAVAGIAIAALAIWVERPRSASPPAGPQLVRVSPDDGYSYTGPAISPDGKFVASISDRSGTGQVWLQQVGGGEPVQITHAANPVQYVAFFPDGTRLLVRTAGGGKGTLEILPTLGGQSRVLLSADSVNGLEYAALSPDGRQVAFFDYAAGEYHLNVISTDGGAPRVLDKWENTQAQLNFTACNWMPDGRNLLVAGSKRHGAPNLDEWDWFVLPLNGGDPIPTGAGDAIRAAGLGITWASSIAADRLLFGSSMTQRGNVWEIRLTPGSWRVAGPPRQFTFGTQNEMPSSVSTDGTAALQISHNTSDFFLIPIDPATGQPTAPARRLTQDGRTKEVRPAGGDPGLVYSEVVDLAGRGPVWTLFSIDLATSRQTELNRNLPFTTRAVISMDGRQVAWTRPDGDRYTISIGAVGSPVESARTLCKDCGFPGRFTPDGRYLECSPETRVKNDPKRKYTTALLEVATGKLTPWLEDPAESIFVGGFFMRDWALVDTERPGDKTSRRDWLVPLRPEPVPRSEWIEFHPPAKTWKYGVLTPFIYGREKSQLMAIKFDAKQKRMSDPFPVQLLSGGAAELRPTDNFNIRGPGMVFEHQETSGSVWLVKLP